MRLQDYDISRRFTATVLRSERLTPDSSPDEVREILLRVEDEAFDAAPGRNVGVLAPGLKNFGQEHHFRLYSVADVPQVEPGSVRFPICVQRCSYLDEYSGERYQGVASNFLCDLREGDTVTLTGPYGPAFQVPADPDTALVLIGLGTGIAPFRAFVNHLYREAPEYRGRVILFHGARTGLDLLYRNDQRDDLARHGDRTTFTAISALSRRPHWSDSVDWGSALEAHGEELWNLLSDPRTCVYLAGLEEIRDELDAVFAGIAGSPEEWARRKAELEAGKRWVELLY